MESSSEKIGESYRTPPEQRQQSQLPMPSDSNSQPNKESTVVDVDLQTSLNTSIVNENITVVPPSQTDRNQQKRRRRKQQPFLVVSMKDSNIRRNDHDRQHRSSSTGSSFFPWNSIERNTSNSKSSRSFWGSGTYYDDDDDYDDWRYHQQHHMAYVTPDFNHWCHLTMALLLCTSMAMLSAYDAEMHCLQHEIYAVLQLVNDDDASIQAAYEAAYNTAIDNEAMKCIHMFQRVILPIGSCTALCAILALTIIYVYSWVNKRRRRVTDNFSTGATNAPILLPTSDDTVEKTTLGAPCDSDSQTSSMSGPISQSAKALLSPYVHQWSTVVSLTLSLFILYLIMFALQTYNVIEVMLKPRTDDSGDDATDNSNPYQSLAAVDRYGQVSDNANLYYLSWLSFGLSIALIYQVSTSCYRVMRASKRHRQSQYRTSDGLYSGGDRNTAHYDPTAYAKTSPSKTNNDGETNLLRTTSWEQCETPVHYDSNENYFETSKRSISHKKRRKLLVDQSRAAWYSSLYRLRVRTGIWTATCITCWIIVASSQYIWRQTLWPSFEHQRNFYNNKYANSGYYANKNGDTTDSTSRDKNSPLSYFSVCHQSSYFSSSMYGSNGNNNGFTPQLCRRTLAAWFVGFVAAILSAAAIAMHVTARYFNKSHHDSSYRLPAKVIQAAVAQQKHQNPTYCRDGTALQAPVTSTPDGKSLTSSSDYYDHDVIQLLTIQTTEAWKSASPSALLSRYYSHHHPNRLPLRTEIVLGILLSILLGVNAVMVTGVEGPALKVGNLYYASWISFLLCVRICLGCIEEYFNVDEEDDEDEGQDSSQASENTAVKAIGAVNIPSGNNFSLRYEAPKLDGCDDIVDTPNNGIEPRNRFDSAHSNDLASVSVDSSSSAAEKQEKKRIGRVRNYFFLSIFSTVCGASSYDAAVNQDMDLTREQKYMMYAPCVVAILSYVMFGLSLSKRCYSMISKFWVGGLLSIVSFSILLGDLLLTMHSEDSWAVNNIGEISMANLYYFAWAAIFTSGVQMSSYVKAIFGIRKLDHMVALWAAICKVCFIILGASLHIWHTISDNCEFDEITLGAVTYCSRTVLAITVSLTGMLVGGLVVLGRVFIIICPNCRCARFQSHVEMLVSLFLVFLFVAAVALITGIGGPGQSVGDLYYSTWGAFWVSIGIFVSCYHQLNEEEKECEDAVLKSDSVLV